MDVPSIMVEEDLTKLREAYRIPADIEFILSGPNERACFSRRGCTALHLNAFESGMRLPLHPMLRRILRAYDLAPTQVAPNGWSQMVGPRKKGREEEVGWFYFCPWGSHKPLVTGCPSSIKQWKESWFWVSGNWQRVFDDPEPNLDVPSVYGIASEQAELDQGRCPWPMLAHLTKQRPKVLASGFVEDTSQRKVIEDLSQEGNMEAVDTSKVIEVDDAVEGEVPLLRKRKVRASGVGASQVMASAVEIVDNYATCRASPLQRTLAVNTSGEIVLEDPSKSTQTLGESTFYPTMGAQAVKKYFTPKWEEFSSHGELEDVLEASLASAIRASTMQMKLDNANAVQKVATEALEAANKEKRRLLEEAKSRDEEISGLRKDLESSENGRKEAEVGKRKVEAKLANAEAEFVANFHNTEAYTNFSDYFARIGQ
ncbi:Uncharacterized protein Adt_11447 [Abeliophyllum distichum]|uniref:Transposase (putative) gypsy type domain-containing protein n=1 Tax=Abeliophyllum distichum TaxID=126358 RepID=A0ABD1UMV8_9LAMI